MPAGASGAADHLFRFWFDCAVFVILFLAQWRIVRTLLAALEQRHYDRTARFVKTLVPYAGLVLAAGYLLSFSQLQSRLPFTSPWLGMFSGCAELWLIASSSGYAFYLLF